MATLLRGRSPAKRVVQPRPGPTTRPTPYVKAAAAAPTKDEFDKLVTAFNTLAKQFDDTITGLAASGVIKLPDKK